MMRSRFASPGYAVMGMGIGHAIWGWAAYRTSLRKIVRAGYVDSVGDGLFRTDHSKDERAAASLLGAAGMAAIPRSGFPAALVLGPWMIRRARQLGQ